MLEWILAQEGWVIYLALAALLLGGVLGLPIPEDLPLLLGGVLIQIGKCDPLVVFAVCYTVVVLGDVLIFLIGRYIGPKVFKFRWFSSRERRAKLKRIRVGLERRSLLMIFLARHLFYLRTLTFLSCGALRMSLVRFLMADVIAALFSVPMILGLGYFAADSYDLMVKALDEFKVISLLVILCGVAIFWTYHLYKRYVESGPDIEDDEVVRAKAIEESAMENSEGKPDGKSDEKLESRSDSTPRAQI